jgi:hypothetical protein
MPRTLRQRPKYKGLPIPFTTFISPDGKPDFRVVDEYSRLLCIERRLCGLCGAELKRGRPIVFIGGDKSCGAGNFLDPAMHEECAVYATTVCPYLTGNQTHRSVGTTSEVIVFDMVSTERPKKMGLYYTRGYDAIDMGESGIYIRAWPSTKIDWDLIPVLEVAPATPVEKVIGPVNFVPPS